MGTMGTTGQLNQQSCKLMENQPGIMGLKFYFWSMMFIHVQPAASEESTGDRWGDRWMLTLNNSASTAYILLLFDPSINLMILIIYDMIWYDNDIDIDMIIWCWSEWFQPSMWIDIWIYQVYPMVPMKLGKTLVFNFRLLIYWSNPKKMSDHVGEIVGQRKTQSFWG